MATTRTTVRVSSDGRILIPVALRRALGIKPGDELVLHVEGGALRITTRIARVREVQAMARTFLAGGPSLVDELIAERRAEAARE